MAWLIGVQRFTEAWRCRDERVGREKCDRAAIAAYGASQRAPKLRCRVVPAEGGLVMEIVTLRIVPTPEAVQELDRLGDEIAELAAHLVAATARLLALIREFDARDGWNNGFSSCAAWLTWRGGLAPRAAPADGRGAGAPGAPPPPAPGPAPAGVS